MYLVSLESSLKMQEIGVGFMLKCTIGICSNLTKSQRVPPLLKNPGSATGVYSNLPFSLRVLGERLQYFPIRLQYVVCSVS